MDLFTARTLVVEQAWSTTNLFLRTRYHVDVYDTSDGHLAAVDERKVPLLTRPARLTQLSGSTPFRLSVDRPDGTTLMTVDKGFSLLRPLVHVISPAGRELGSIERANRSRYPIADHAGAQLGTFDYPSGRFTAADGAEVGLLERRVTAVRAGRRVGRDLLHVHPSAAGPLRTMVIATALALDVVRGNGTARNSAVTWN